MKIGNSKGNGETPSNSASFDSTFLARAVGSLDEIHISNGFDRYPCRPADALRVPQSSRILLRGWAANHRADGPTSDFQVTVDGIRTRAIYGLERHDVATAHARTDMLATGFRIAVNTEGLHLGPHELRILTRDDGQTRELAVVPFTLVTQVERHILRPNTIGLFDFELDAFHAFNRPPSTVARIERRVLAIVRGRIHERLTGTAAATLTGVIDGFDGTPAQLGYPSKNRDDDAFVLCFTTDELSLGEHTLDLVATNARGELESVASASFSIAPLCCGPAHPVESPHIAPAEIVWTSQPSHALSRSEIATFGGWAIDPITGEGAGAISLVFGDGRHLPLSIRGLREDVARELGLPKTRFCGFVGSVAFDTFAPGTHVANVVIESKDQTRRHRTDAKLSFELDAKARAVLHERVAS